MSWENESHFVSTDPGLLDLDFVCAALAGSYWANDRPRDVVARSIGASLCFGLYDKHDGRQVGFARVVTDASTFSCCATSSSTSAKGARASGSS